MDPLATKTQLELSAQRAFTVEAADQYLEWSSAIVRGYCGWHIATVEALTATVDGTHTNRIFLPAMQIRSVESIHVDGELQTFGDHYRWNRAGRIRRINGLWRSAEESITVEFTAGYDEVPAAVSAVVAALAGRLSSGQWTQQRIGSLSVGMSLTTPPGGWTDYEAKILDRYVLT